MDRHTQRLIAVAAIGAPLLHSATDVMEWWQGGFSDVQLWLNYAAFLPIPAVLIGLYAAQRPRIARLGLWGAVTYGWAFIYFAHTTLLALERRTADYERLWDGLGLTYTLHGILMIVGGACFAWATLRAAVLPRWTATVFVAGLAVNLLLGLLPLPDVLQTIGTALRNAGLAGMGYAIWHRDGAHATRGRLVG